MEPNTQQQGTGQNVVQGSAQGGAASGGQAGGQQVDYEGGAAGGGQRAMTSAEGSHDRRTGGVIRPPVDVIEDPQGITLLADMPGVSKDKLNLRLESQSLTIEGAMAIDWPENMDSRYAEILHQHYERTFALSRELDGEKATAELYHGVLKIRIPKTAQAAPRKIPVNVAST